MNELCKLFKSWMTTNSEQQEHQLVEVSQTLEVHEPERQDESGAVKRTKYQFTRRVRWTETHAMALRPRLRPFLPRKCKRMDQARARVFVAPTRRYGRLPTAPTRRHGRLIVAPTRRRGRRRKPRATAVAEQIECQKCTPVEAEQTLMITEECIYAQAELGGGQESTLVAASQSVMIKEEYIDPAVGSPQQTLITEAYMDLPFKNEI